MSDRTHFQRITYSESEFESESDGRFLRTMRHVSRHGRDVIGTVVTIT